MEESPYCILSNLTTIDFIAYRYRLRCKFERQNFATCEEKFLFKIFYLNFYLKFLFIWRGLTNI